jgi:lipopolysaccharide export system protein LptA
MSGFNHKSFFLAIPIILCLITPSVLLSESKTKQNAGSERTPIVINADSLEVDDTKKVVTFKGHVDVRESNLTMTCDKLLLYYTNKPADKPAGKPTDSGSADAGIKIDKIVATGNVKVIQPDGGVAVAEKAIYYQYDEKIVLTGNPKVKQGQDFVEGAKITVFIRENRSIVEGSKNKKVKAVYYPRGGIGVPRGR